MRLITEKRDVQDRVIEYLQAIGWKYIRLLIFRRRGDTILKNLSSLKFLRGN